jgi:hypothetical protein
LRRTAGLRFFKEQKRAAVFTDGEPDPERVLANAGRVSFLV